MSSFRIRICFSAASARVPDFVSISHPITAEKHKSRLGGCQDRLEDGAGRPGSTHRDIICLHEHWARLQAATDGPEIARTSPSVLGNNHGKYSAGGSAAQRYSWKAARDGGGLSATKDSLGTLLPMPVTDFALGFQKRQPLQGENGAGLFLTFLKPGNRRFHPAGFKRPGEPRL